MNSSIDIDIGGTFTDCVLMRNGELTRWKSPTTRYDLAVGVRDAIQGCAEQGELSYGDLLAQLDVVRYSTTIAMNALLERKGPKLGVITTAGNEHMFLIGRSRQWADGLYQREVRNMARIKKPQPLIPLEMVVGIRERIDYSGKVVCPIDADDVAAKVRQLVDNGAQGFVVVLLWSHVNSIHEDAVRQIIEDSYPDVHLGGTPVFCSSEVAPTWHEYPRANTTVLNAFLQAALQNELSSLGHELRVQGYRKPLLVVNNVGGAAKVSRTRALDTWGAGPVAGLFGSAFLANRYGLEQVVVTDMGGTSFDFGTVTGGEARFYTEQPVIDRWLTETSMIEVKSIGAGGGSIAWLNAELDNRLEVGPQSAGANPGPACYAQGGREPTVTDADVVLGLLDPDFFLGGRIRLDRELAERAIRRRIADPLGIDVMEAAVAIRRAIDAHMGDVIAKEIYLRGLDVREFSLFAYGGAGPLHCTDYVRQLSPTMDCYTFLYSSVFCALGAATMDLRHLYERSSHISLCEPRAQSWLEDFETFNAVVHQLRQDAERDVVSEGFSVDDMSFSLELDMRYDSQQHLTRVRSPHLTLASNQDVRDLAAAFSTEYVRRFTEISLDPNGAVEIENFHLSAQVQRPKPVLMELAQGTADATSARIGSRDVFWPDLGRQVSTNVYSANDLLAGNVIQGPAIVQAADTTIVVPTDRTLTIDRIGTALLRTT
jgi:N-methylhydantoinase A/oxoprolinase/acetone carboxylase beta subunit